MMWQNKKGYVALIAAVMLPVVMSFFYYMVKNYHFSYDRTAFEQAVTTAATTAARHYIDQLNFANHSDYIKRKATVAFNNALKMQTTIKQNMLPVKDQVLEYSKKEVGSLYSVGNTVANSSATPNYYDRYGFFKGNIYAKTGVDPDVDSITGFMADGVYGYVIYRAFNGQAFPNISDSDSRKYTDDDALRVAVGGSSPSSSKPNVKKTIVAVDGKGTSKSGASLTIARNDDDTLKVEAAYRLNGKNYKKEVIAHAPILKADIVFGIPTNFAACTETNNASNSLGNCNKSPIYEIGQTLHEAIKDMLSYRECAMGVIPYSGKVSLPGVVSTKSHGTYKYSDYPAVNPTIPIAESYRFICDEAGGTLNGTSNSLGHITGLMIRSDMIKSGRKSEKYYVEDQIDSSKFLECVTNSTKFMTYPLHISYGGYSNIMAGYSRKRMTNYPNPYPMLGLTEDKLKIFRYLTTLFPYNESTNKSSMGYLPVMFGMSMLDDGTLFNADIYSGISDRKKALILIANQDDTFEKNDLTYLGFSNDGSHISMIDGDLLDLEKDKYIKQVDGYYCSPDAYQKPGNRIDTDKYRKNTMIKTTYDKSVLNSEGDPMACFVINQHDAINGVSCSANGSVEKKDGKYYCYIDYGSDATFIIMTSGKAKSCSGPNCGMALNYYYSIPAIDTSATMNKCKLNAHSDNITVTANGDNVTLKTSGKYGVHLYFATYSITLTSTAKKPQSNLDIILPKPGNTKIVLWNDISAVLKIFPDISSHGMVTVDDVSISDGPGKVVKKDNIHNCAILDKSSYITCRVKCTKKDESPVILRTECGGCEYVSVNGDNLCLRQDENYVYICDTKERTGTRTYEFYLTIKPITNSSQVIQHAPLGYFKSKLSIIDNWSQEGSALSSTEISGNGYNVWLGPNVNQSLTEGNTNATVSKICEVNKVSEVPVNYVCDYWEGDVEYRTGTCANAYQAYMGIHFSDSNTSPFSGYTRIVAGSGQNDALNGIWKIVAEWNSSNNTNLEPSCYTNSTSWGTSPYTRIYEYTTLYTAPNDGDKATVKKINCIKNVEIVAADMGFGSWSIDCAKINDHWEITPWKGNWCKLKITYDDNNYVYPILSNVTCAYTQVCEADQLVEELSEETGADKAFIRADKDKYYIVNRQNKKEAYLYLLKHDLWWGQQCKWQVAYANKHLIGADNDTSSTPDIKKGNQKSYTFLGPGDANGNDREYNGLQKYPYYVYGTGIKLTAYSRNTEWRYERVNRFHVGINERTNDVKLYTAYKLVKKDSEYCFNNYVVSTSSVPSGYLRNSEQIRFSSNYIKTKSNKTRSIKPALWTLEFSGAYSKSYDNLVYGYNVVYIPRDKITPTASDDSATIKMSYIKLLSVEWSNHLNGTEGLYSCSSSEGNDAKLYNGGSAIYYEQIQPTKNAMFVSFMNTGGNLNYLSGLQKERLSSVNISDTRLEDLLNVYWGKRYGGFLTVLSRVTSGISSSELQDISFVGNDRRKLHDRYHDNYFSWSARFYDPTESVIHGIIRCYYRLLNEYSIYTNVFNDLIPDVPLFSYRSFEMTNNINRILEACGYHGTKSDNGYPRNAKEAIKQATKAAIKKFNEKFGKNGRIYVIKYRWSDADKNKDDTYADVYKSYIVDAPTKAGELTTTQRLHKALRLILRDIEKWANITSAKIVEKPGKA